MTRPQAALLLAVAATALLGGCESIRPAGGVTLDLDVLTVTPVVTRTHVTVRIDK